MPFLDDFGSVMANFLSFFSIFLTYRRNTAMRFIFHARQTRLHAPLPYYRTNELSYLMVICLVFPLEGAVRVHRGAID